MKNNILLYLLGLILLVGCSKDEENTGYIKLLDHVVVCPVYNLPDIQQVCI